MVQLAILPSIRRRAISTITAKTFGACPVAATPAKAKLISRQFRQSSKALRDELSRDIEGTSGRTYTIQNTLQDKGIPLGCVYRATDGHDQFVLKEIPQDWAVRTAIYRTVANCHHIRLPVDTIPEKRILVFDHIDAHLLELVQENMPLVQTKQILKHTLQGIANLHELGVAHNDIKANNILVQISNTMGDMNIEKVLITDLEDAVQLQPGGWLQGATIGNLMWRSPEAHAAGPMQMPSDIFAFAIVCIYALTKTLIFAIENEDLSPDSKTATTLWRHLSYFGDEKGFKGLLEYLGEDNAMRDIFEAVEEGCRDVPRNSLMKWTVLDDDCKDLLQRMTKLDPRQRITAQEALKHRWFEDV